MPPFNPAMIGAPSPVGRGGGGSSDLPVGAIGHFATNPGPKYAPCSGAYLTAQSQTKWPFKLVASAIPDFVAASTLAGNVRSLIFAQGLFVAATTNGIYTSPDAVTWTRRSTNSNPVQVVYDGGQFVAVGISGTLLTSPDAITWTSRTTPATVTITNVAFGNGRYLALVGGNPGQALLSADGVVWTSISVPGINPTAMAYSPDLGLFVICGFTNGGSTDFIYTTIDGQSWTQRANALSGGYARAVTWGNGLFVAGMNGGITNRSADGIVWTGQQTDTRLGEIQDLIYAAGFYLILGGQAGFGSYSDDGVTWRNVNPNPDTPMSRAAYGAGRFIAGSNQSGGIRSALAIEDSVFLPNLPAKPDPNGVRLRPYMRIVP